MLNKIDGLTREQVSVRVGHQLRRQRRRQQDLRSRHRGGMHTQVAVKCDLCQEALAKERVLPQ
jgi:hypothetical protein